MKITKEQFAELSQLDRIEIGQGALENSNKSLSILIIFAIMLYTGHTLEAFIFLLIGLLIINYWYNKLMQRIMNTFFEVKVKRNIREVKK